MGCSESKEKPPEPKLRKREQSKTPAAKIVLLGEAGVGKSSICQRYINNHVSEYYEVTIGGAYMQKEVMTSIGQKITLHIWDTGGEERYKAMAPLYYRDAHAVLLVYDITNKRTFKMLNYWIRELEDRVQTEGLVIVCAGNKCDLAAKAVEDRKSTRLNSSH